MRLPGARELSLPFGVKGEVVALFTNRGFTEILADKQFDAQIGYTFPDEFAQGLGVLLQVSNLTELALSDAARLRSQAARRPATARRCPRPTRNTAASSARASTTSSKVLRGPLL